MGKKKKQKIEFRYYKTPDGFPLLALLGQKWTKSYGDRVDNLHFHNYLEIGYCYEGEGILTIGEKYYQFSGNQFTVIPQNCPHTTTCEEGVVSRWEYLFIDVEELIREIYPSGGSTKRVEQMLHRINSRSLFKNAEEMPEVSGRILELLNIMREAKEFYQEEAKGVLVALLVNLVRENRLEVQQPREKDLKSSTMISAALDYISVHYMEPIRIEQLAEVCHISESHFRRVFSSYVNMGPLEYINLIRIRNACELLRKTLDPISDIAYKCGFTTISTFNRNFKQAMGSSPFEWRKRSENFEQQLLKFEVRSEKGW